VQAIIEAASIGIAVGLVAGILAVLAAVPWKPSKEPRGWFHVAVPLLLGAAYVGTLLIKEGWPGWKPDESWLRLMHVVIAATVIAVITGPMTGWWWLRVVTAIVVAGAVAWLFDTPASIDQPMQWKLIVAGHALIGWAALEPLAAKRDGVTLPLGLTLVFIAAFVLLLDRMNFARAAPPLAAVAAALAMIAIGALIKPSINLAHGTLLAVLLMLYGTIITGWLYVQSYTQLDWWVPGAVAAAPLALWIGEAPLLRSRRRWLHVTIAVGFTALIAGGGIAFAALTAEPDPYAGY